MSIWNALLQAAIDLGAAAKTVQKCETEYTQAHASSKRISIHKPDTLYANVIRARQHLQDQQGTYLAACDEYIWPLK